MEQIYFVLEALIEAVQFILRTFNLVKSFRPKTNSQEFKKKKKLKSDKSIFGGNALSTLQAVTCNSCNALA